MIENIAGDFTPIHALFDNRTSAERAIEGIITAGGEIENPEEVYDMAAIYDEMIEWQNCYLTHRGETVEWLPGSGFVIPALEEDGVTERGESFWECVAAHEKPLSASEDGGQGNENARN